MKKRTTLLVAVISLATASAPLWAHHAFAAEFDSTRPVKLSGIVAKVEWTNPHAHFYVDVKDEVWELELASPNALQREGWTRNSLKPGDRVFVNGYMARDGSKLANAREVRLADGRRVFAGSSLGRNNTPPVFSTSPE